MQHVKKNRDPRWEEEFTFTLDEPPVNERLHVEVLSTSSRIGLLHPKVWKIKFIIWSWMIMECARRVLFVLNHVV